MTLMCPIVCRRFDYEGDFGVLVTKLEKMNDQLAMYGSAITAIARDVHGLQAVVWPRTE